MTASIFSRITLFQRELHQEERKNTLKYDVKVFCLKYKSIFPNFTVPAIVCQPDVAVYIAVEKYFIRVISLYFVFCFHILLHTS